MHFLIDGLGVRPGSTTVVVENLIAGWCELPCRDRLTVAVGPHTAELNLPAGVEIYNVAPRDGGRLLEAWRRTLGIRRLAKRLKVDAVVSPVVTSGFLGATRPRAVLVGDLRHEILPHQFKTSRRLARRVAFGLSLREATYIGCNSERTRQDLVRRYPAVGGKTFVSSHGADHVDRWPAPKTADTAYALAFGKFPHKGTATLLRAWQAFRQDGGGLELRMVGVPSADRPVLADQANALGIQESVTLLPWLSDTDFIEEFSAASVVVFPSEFEGFGLPAIEALRLRIPLVVSDDPALLEVTGGHATVVEQLTPEELARSIVVATSMTPEQLMAGHQHTEGFRWSMVAQRVRDGLTKTTSG